MVSFPDTQPTPPSEPTRCPGCSYLCPPDELFCPRCGHRLGDESNTMPLALPNTAPYEPISPGTNILTPAMKVYLRFEPGADTLQLNLSQPVILGRQVIAGPENVVDLTPFNSFRHGVSRRHCRIERRDDRLIIIDLASSNGTYLNRERLLPYRDYIVSNGDQLVLGTLRIDVIFHRPDHEEDSTTP